MYYITFDLEWNQAYAQKALAVQRQLSSRLRGEVIQIGAVKLNEDMQPCGLVDRIEERLMDGVSALSGSGPAYLYVMMEAMADGAVACGIPKEKALEYAAMTMVGAAEIYLQTHTHPAALKDAVCSPGGSTIAGIRVLEQNGFRGAVMDCVAAAYQRNKELGKG